MSHRFHIGPKVVHGDPTVPQLRGNLEQVLLAVQGEEVFADVAEHVLCAIAALDRARALAHVVLCECEAERGAMNIPAIHRHKLC
jgi:hypothetical protein